MATIVPISIDFVKNYSPGSVRPPLYRGLALRELPADSPLDHVGDRREVLPAPAFLHRLVIRPLGLLEHRRGHLRDARQVEGEPGVLAHELTHEGRRELPVEDALGASVEISAEGHAAALPIHSRLHADGE